MAKLTAAKRKKIPTKEFALSGRREPINDKSHAKAALTMGMRDKSPAEKAKIRAAVHRKFPDLGKKKEGASMKKTMGTKKTMGVKKGMSMKKGMKGACHDAIGGTCGYTMTAKKGK